MKKEILKILDDSKISNNYVEDYILESNFDEVANRILTELKSTSREQAKREGLKRCKGRNHRLWKAGLFASGAMWMKMIITGESDIIK